MKLTVCLLASEAAPLSKTGGLGEVSGALARYLHGAGHDVRLFTPLYASIDRSRLQLREVEGLRQLELQAGAHRYVLSVSVTQLPDSTAPVYLIDCPQLYERATLYTSDPDEHLRFLAFTRAVITACQRMRWAPQIFHCNDWHTAFGPLYLQTLFDQDPLFSATRSLLTIHNIGYQGIFPATLVADVEMALGSIEEELAA